MACDREPVFSSLAPSSRRPCKSWALHRFSPIGTENQAKHIHNPARMIELCEPMTSATPPRHTQICSASLTVGRCCCKKASRSPVASQVSTWSPRKLNQLTVKQTQIRSWQCLTLRPDSRFSARPLLQQAHLASRDQRFYIWVNHQPGAWAEITRLSSWNVQVEPLRISATPKILRDSTLCDVGDMPSRETQMPKAKNLVAPRTFPSGHVSAVQM